MKAVVFHAVGDMRVDDVSEPAIRDAEDAIRELTGGRPDRDARPGVAAETDQVAPEQAADGRSTPGGVLTQVGGVRTAEEAYEAFDARDPGRLKVELEPAA